MHSYSERHFILSTEDFLFQKLLLKILRVCIIYKSVSLVFLWRKVKQREWSGIMTAPVSCSFATIYIHLNSKRLVPVVDIAELVLGRFEQNNMHCTLDICPDQPGRKSSVTKLRSYCLNMYIFGVLPKRKKKLVLVGKSMAPMAMPDNFFAC